MDGESVSVQREASFLWLCSVACICPIRRQVLSLSVDLSFPAGLANAFVGLQLKAEVAAELLQAVRRRLGLGALKAGCELWQVTAHQEPALL